MIGGDPTLHTIASLGFKVKGKAKVLAMEGVITVLVRVIITMVTIVGETDPVGREVQVVDMTDKIPANGILAGVVTRVIPTKEIPGRGRGMLTKGIPGRGRGILARGTEINGRTRKNGMEGGMVTGRVGAMAMAMVDRVAVRLPPRPPSRHPSLQRRRLLQRQRLRFLRGAMALQ